VVQVLTGKSFGYGGETLQEIQQELADAIKIEDFARAHALKLRRDELLAKDSQLPGSLEMN